MKPDINQFREIIHQYYPVYEDALQSILQIVEIRSLEKGNVFIQKNKPDYNEYFIIEGICRSYLYDTEGRDITISFYDDGKVIAPHLSRTLKSVSLLNYECLTDCSIGMFSASAFCELMDRDENIRSFAYNVLQYELRQKIEKEINNASLTAKMRLMKFREQFKSLENKIYHPHIASYLGITNISLSRLRKELSDF